MEMLTKGERAEQILTELFKDRTRIRIAEAVAAGAPHDVSRRTLQRAATKLGVREVHNGNHPGFWEWKR